MSPPAQNPEPQPVVSRWHRFRPRLLDTLPGYTRQRFVADFGAGLTVGVVALPLAMAFAIASGVKPEAGLVTAIVAGFLISALGGSNVQIGGPAGAFIVIVYGIVERYGLANLLISTMLAGVLLMAMGLFKLGALVRYVPVSIIIGFTNGIAVLIALSQLRDLFGLTVAGAMPSDFFALIGTLVRHAETWNPHALALGLVCFVGLFVWPRLVDSAPVQRFGQHSSVQAVSRIPGPVVALVTATLFAALVPWPVETIGSLFGGIPQSLPALAWPEFTWAGVKQLVIPTLTIALLGAIESLLCARVADNMTELPRHDPNQELMAQGVANVVAPLFGGIPATGTIARTVTNVRAGATSPIAGIVHAMALLTILLLAAPLALHVPLAALAGILLFVAWNMGEWREFTRLRQFNLPYRTILVGTFVLTIVFDLMVAVEVGLVLACAFFIYRMGSQFSALPITREGLPAGVQAFELYGSLFFGAVGKIEALEAQIDTGTRALVLEMHRLVLLDTSGLDALQQLHRSLQRRGVTLVLANVNEQPLSLIRRAGFELQLGSEGIVPRLEDLLKPVEGDSARP
ncbi:MAG: SulP family inorganic anion transporter [Rubrivivax sp.]